MSRASEIIKDKYFDADDISKKIVEQIEKKVGGFSYALSLNKSRKERCEQTTEICIELQQQILDLMTVLKE